MFWPGGLTALTSLFIWEPKSVSEDFRSELMGRAAPTLYGSGLREHFLVVAKTLLRHPSLVEVSGQSRLFQLGVFCEQTGWTEGIASGSGPTHRASCFCSICTAGVYQRWTKAQSG